MSTTYQIKLPQFEGPFDLLLFFIERDELDIHDIPISQITTSTSGPAPSSVSGTPISLLWLPAVAIVGPAPAFIQRARGR